MFWLPPLSFIKLFLALNIDLKVPNLVAKVALLKSNRSAELTGCFAWKCRKGALPSALAVPMPAAPGVPDQSPSKALSWINFATLKLIQLRSLRGSKPNDWHSPFHPFARLYSISIINIQIPDANSYVFEALIVQLLSVGALDARKVDFRPNGKSPSHPSF